MGTPGTPLDCSGMLLAPCDRGCPSVVSLVYALVEAQSRDRLERTCRIQPLGLPPSWVAHWRTRVAAFCVCPRVEARQRWDAALRERVVAAVGGAPSQTQPAAGSVARARGLASSGTDLLAMLVVLCPTVLQGEKALCSAS